MRFSVDWQDDAANAAAEEKATVADLRLWLGDQNVTQNIRDTKHRDHITVALYNIAEGLIYDWWTLFGGREKSISLIKYRSGYAVPDIRLSFDGAAFEMWSEQRTYGNPPLRFWAGPTVVMTRSEAEEKLTAFIETVLDRLQSCRIDDTGASRRWTRVKASRVDPGEASFCESAGALSLDPYQIGDADASAIEDAADLFEGEPLTEFVAGARWTSRPLLVQWVRNVESRRPDASRIAELQAVADAVANKSPVREGEEPWATGYRRARKLRDILGLAENRRFDGFDALAASVGAEPSYEPAGSADGIRLLRSHVGSDVHLHMRRHGQSTVAQASQLFTFARGIGDVVCYPAPQRAPVNDLRLAFRQAAGRAFAAEFLAPINEILSMQDDGRDVLAIADEFAVSTDVIERQMENAARIETACR